MNDINFKTIEKMTAEQLQNYIDQNQFSDKQAIAIYQHHNKTHKQETYYIAKNEGIISIAKDIDDVHVFTKNFEQLADMDISSNELKVIAKILNKMEFGNCFHVSQVKLCKELGMKKSNMSIIFKKLRSKNIIIDRDGDLFMNSNIFLKGQYHSINKKQRPNVKKAQEFNVNNIPVFHNVYTYHQETDMSDALPENELDTTGMNECGKESVSEHNDYYLAEHEKIETEKNDNFPITEHYC